MPDFEGSEARPKNAYNDSLGYLGRLNALWYKVNGARIRLEVSEWYHYLVAVYQELVTQIDVENRPEYLKVIDDIKLMLQNPYFYLGDQVMLKSSVYAALMDLETSLRDVWHAAGFDMKQSTTDDLNNLL